MKRILLVTLIGLLSFTYSSAQLADGSIAPDWTLTDHNGTAHNLYNYLVLILLIVIILIIYNLKYNKKEV